MIPFTEDQWWRLTTNLHVTTHSLKYSEKFIRGLMIKNEKEWCKRLTSSISLLISSIIITLINFIIIRALDLSAQILTATGSTHISGAIGTIAPNAEQSLRKPASFGKEMSDIYGH